MDIEKDLKWIHQEIENIKDPKTIKKLKVLLESINYPNNNSIESYNLDIENSIINITEGKFYTEDQARKIILKKNII